MTRDEARMKMEDGCQELSRGASMPIHEIAAISQAISLKRIADVLNEMLIIQQGARQQPVRLQSDTDYDMDRYSAV